jgi:hypothetical protein
VRKAWLLLAAISLTFVIMTAAVVVMASLLVQPY